MMTLCNCITAPADDERSYDLHSFEELWRNCTALNNVFIPQRDWINYRDFCLAERDEAQHQPIMWLAYRRGYLGNFTRPIHQFILEGKPETNTITKKYKGDLAERWFLKGCFLERYRASRIFEGRVAELRFTLWLRQNGWEISSLEAYGGQFDIEAQSPKATQTLFEVKYLATEEYRFLIDVQALKNGGVSVGCASLYSPLDYLLCRAYEAANQLDGAGPARIATLILKDYSVFNLQLEDHWIHWDNPSLFKKDQDIQPFLDKFRKKYPNFEDDMVSRFKSLSQIWILQDTRDSGLELKYRIDPVTGHQV